MSQEWIYELTFTQDNQRRPVITREWVKHRDTVLLDRPGQDDDADPERLRQTYLEQVNVNREYRDVADFLASVRYLHVVRSLSGNPTARLAGRTIR